MNDAAAVIATLPKLSVSDLQAVRDRVAVLLTLEGKSPAPPAVAGFEANLASALAGEISKRVGAVVHPLQRSAAQRSRFKEAAAIVEAANAQWFPHQMKAQETSMLRMYAQVICDDVQERGKPLVWDLVIFATAELPALMAKQFPGYGRSGMMELVQNLRTKLPDEPVQFRRNATA